MIARFILATATLLIFILFDLRSGRHFLPSWKHQIPLDTLQDQHYETALDYHQARHTGYSALRHPPKLH